jgi:hypothetical protein
MRAGRWLRGLLGSGLLVAGSAAAMAGCTTEAVCFDNCRDSSPIVSGGAAGTAGTGGVSGSFVIGMGGEDDPGTAAKPGVGGGGAPLEDAGTECDAADLTSDVDNCGACGVHCILTGAEAKCVAGKCEIAECLEHRYDVDGKPEDGCELACDGDPTDDEICNGEDDNCDGRKDEGFDLASDVDNCGACGIACDLQHASSKCEAGACRIDACAPGFHSVDGLDSTGCEYPCHIKDANGNDCDPPAPGDPNPNGCGVEICDDIDQDCDGDTAKVVDAKKPCADFCPTADCLGTCTFGTTQCIGSVLICVPDVTPTLDICDGLDNNCNGQTDEDFDFDSDPQHCGDCGTSCVGTLPHAFAKCENKQCMLDVCETDYGDLNPSSPGCELCPVTPVRAESCNGKDDDCDGQVDEPAEVVLTKPASGAMAANSYCRQKAGTLCDDVPLHCDSNVGGWVCDYPANVEVASGKVVITEGLCDGIDGNCDGQVDEAFLDLGKTCDDGALGVCRDFGKTQCNPSDRTKTYCNTSLPPDPPDASNEACNGKDDDCDGEIDEDTDQMVRITRNSLDFWIDKYEASRPDASSSAAGTDETHVCGIPNRLPWTGASFDEADEACAASNKRLCRITELEEACQGASAKTYPYGTIYAGTKCNGSDAPGSAAAPTGSFPGCVTTDGVFDLSGNVAEWSQTKKGETTGSPKYDIMALHGGSYLTPQNGLTCKFDFDVMSTNAVLPSLGFRCCKDAP